MRLRGRGATLRTVAFGALDGSRWGAVIDAGEPVLASFGANGAGVVQTASELQLDGKDWQVGGLTVSPVTVPSAPAQPDGSPAPALDWAAPPELCRVTESVIGVDRSEPATCIGIRCTVDDVALADVRSLRLVAAWFSETEAATLLSLRPTDRGDHAHDRLIGALFDPQRWIESIDPRLSTTYDAAGHPTRANLELWIRNGDDEYPRRVAGEAGVGDLSGIAAGFTVQARPLVTHSRGNDGAGLYLLAER